MQPSDTKVRERDIERADWRKEGWRGAAMAAERNRGKNNKENEEREVFV